MISLNEYLEELPTKIKSGFKSLAAKIELDLYRISIFTLSSTLILLVIFLIPILIKGDYESILKIAEFAIIGSGTLAILTFTYTIAIEKSQISETHKKIIYSGELLLKSTISFIIGLGLLPIVGIMLRNHTSFSIYGIFNEVVIKIFSPLATFIIFVIGIISLMYSAYCLGIGIMELIEVFEKKEALN